MKINNKKKFIIHTREFHIKFLFGFSVKVWWFDLVAVISLQWLSSGIDDDSLIGRWKHRNLCNFFLAVSQNVLHYDN